MFGGISVAGVFNDPDKKVVSKSEAEVCLAHQHRDFTTLAGVFITSDIKWARILKSSRALPSRTVILLGSLVCSTARAKKVDSCLAHPNDDFTSLAGGFNAPHDKAPSNPEVESCLALVNRDEMDTCPKRATIVVGWDDTQCPTSAMKDLGTASRGLLPLSVLPCLREATRAAINLWTVSGFLQHATKVVIVTDASQGLACDLDVCLGTDSPVLRGRVRQRCWASHPSWVGNIRLPSLWRFLDECVQPA